MPDRSSISQGTFTQLQQIKSGAAPGHGNLSACKYSFPAEGIQSFPYRIVSVEADLSVRRIDDDQDLLLVITAQIRQRILFSSA